MNYENIRQQSASFSGKHIIEITVRPAKNTVREYRAKLPVQVQQPAQTCFVGLCSPPTCTKNYMFAGAGVAIGVAVGSPETAVDQLVCPVN